MLCADFGAQVLRIDRPVKNPAAAPTSDQLTPGGVLLLKSLIPEMDILIEPFRPGVMEKMGLGPEVLMKLNPRLIYARMTGFRRDGKYASMAGHDINYIAVSGVLSMLGRKNENPYPPGNLLGDFGGGGLTCFLGIVLAVLNLQRTGRGQVVEANMVDGSAYLATMPRLATKGPAWNGPRGTNMLDGGCPYYNTYKTQDGGYMAVGSLEPQFFAALLKGLGIRESEIGDDRLDKKTWPKQAETYAAKFKEKTRKEWESIFDGTDACCTPVLTQAELEQGAFDQRPVVTLGESPSFGIQRAPAEGRPGAGGEEALVKLMKWKQGKDFEERDGGYEAIGTGNRSKL